MERLPASQGISITNPAYQMPGLLTVPADFSEYQEVELMVRSLQDPVVTSPSHDPGLDRQTYQVPVLASGATSDTTDIISFEQVGPVDETGYQMPRPAALVSGLGATSAHNSANVEYAEVEPHAGGRLTLGANRATVRHPGREADSTS